MTNQKLIKRIIEIEEKVVPTLFKPVQFNILKKIIKNKKLTENEKRYLRGSIKQKLELLELLGRNDGDNKDGVGNKYVKFLNNIDSYYITGLEAIKQNGYGWFFDVKVIEVINTKIEGRIKIGDKLVKLFRVNSIENRKFTLNKETCLNYATNEQIIKDIIITKNEDAKNIWLQMCSRYKKVFAKNSNDFIEIAPKEEEIVYEIYGV